MNIKVGLICTRGLPARYGAYEQCVESLVSSESTSGVVFFVPTVSRLMGERYNRDNVVRLGVPRRDGGVGSVLYGLASWLKCYFRGVRVFIFFGYSLSPFFWLFSLMGCKIICNTDGIEWRRAKWSKFGQRFLKFCEFCAAQSGANLVFDSYGIKRYYNMKHKVDGELIFYGHDRELTDRSDGYEESLLEEFGLKRDHFYVVVMRMEPENNVSQIVDAALEYEKLPFPIVFIGPSTPFFEKVCMPLIESASAERIIYLGPIYDRTKLGIIRRASAAYIHGHSVGGTNPTLIEACSFKNSIVAFNSIFNREILGNDSQYFSDSTSLHKVLLDSNFKRFTRDLGPEYTWQAVSSQYIRMIEKVTDE